MVAHLLKQTNPTAKILLVDPKENFSKQALFEEGWQKHYSGMIERIGPDFGGANVYYDKLDESANEGYPELEFERRAG